MFHLIMTLLIYTVDSESVKCPKNCTCIESFIIENNNNNPENQIINFEGKNFSETNLNQNLNSYKIILNDVEMNGARFYTGLSQADNKTSASISSLSTPSSLSSSTSLSSSPLSSSSSSSSSSPLPSSQTTSFPINYSKEKKCSKNTLKDVKDIFINNFFTKPGNNSQPNNNSKEIRMKRTLNVNVQTSFNAEGPTEKTNDPSRMDSSSNDDKLKKRSTTAGKEGNVKPSGIFTYQITCNGIRDLKSLWLQYLPNPTTQLIIRRTYFQSFKLFRQILKESPAKLSQLTLLSITDSVINQKLNEKYQTETNLKKKDSSIKVFKENEEFLPFASLQNPKLRPKSQVQTVGNFHGKFKNVKILNLVNNSLTFIPQDLFFQFQNLEILNLSNNLIKFIEDETFNPLINLLQLDIHANRLLSLNELVFKNLTRLLYLDVSENSISNLAPSTFQYLTSLNLLNLASNPLSEKQEAVILLGTGKRLQIVDISRTGIKQIPGTLERSVRVLNLMGNHLLSIRCGDLDSYFLLSYLNLRDNKISYVEDDALGRLEFLKSLQISENNLFQIPKSLPNNLEILNLSNNNIQNITALDFLNLSLLKELLISYNQVSYIEGNAFNNLLHLEILDLSHNPILVLPTIYGMFKLTNLNLSYLTNIPGRFSVRYKQFPIQSPENVKHLNLASSPSLTTILLQDTKTLDSFIHLEELDVRFSNLTTMRKDIFGLLPNLKILKVEGNPWHCGKEILILSDWLKSHENENAAQDEDEINTAHCSTPTNLYKTALVALEESDFDDAGNKNESEKETHLNKTTFDATNGENSVSNNSQVLKNSRKISNEKFETIKNFSASGKNRTVKSTAEVQKVFFKKYSKTSEKVKTFTNLKTKENSRVENTFPESEEKLKKPLDENSSVMENKSTSFNNTTSPSNPIYLRSDNNKNITVGCNSTDFKIPVKNSLELKKTETSLRTVNKAEAVTAKDGHPSEKEYNSHLSFFILSSIGFIAMASLTFTSVYFSRTRRDQSYQRQTQDIEVCSISSIGNELW